MKNLILTTALAFVAAPATASAADVCGAVYDIAYNVMAIRQMDVLTKPAAVDLIIANTRNSTVETEQFLNDVADAAWQSTVRISQSSKDSAADSFAAMYRGACESVLK